jgi:hypothetical protein
MHINSFLYFFLFKRGMKVKECEFFLFILNKGDCECLKKFGSIEKKSKF